MKRAAAGVESRGEGLRIAAATVRLRYVPEYGDAVVYVGGKQAIVHSVGGRQVKRAAAGVESRGEGLRIAAATIRLRYVPESGDAVVSVGGKQAIVHSVGGGK